MLMLALKPYKVIYRQPPQIMMILLKRLRYIGVIRSNMSKRRRTIQKHFRI